MTDTFSVIVANYNNGRYLTALIKSLQAQTYNNWELVIADDASTDDSITVINEYIQKDNRIKLVRHNSNKGAGATFKSAMDASSGALIGMLGADDALVPEALSVMAEAHAVHPATGMITSMAYDCDDELKPIGLCSISGKQPENISLIHEIHICNFVTFKKSAYNKTEGFNPYFQRAVDHDIYLKMEEAGPIAFVDKPVYLYRRHDMGISQGGNGMKAATFSLMAHIQAYERRNRSGFKPNLTRQEFRDKSITYHQRMALQYRLSKQYIPSVRSNWQCVQLSALYILNPKFWTTLLYNVKGMVFHA